MRSKRRMKCRRTSLAFLQAWFVDLPWIIDSSLRHIDFTAFRLWRFPFRPPDGAERQVPQGAGLLCALNFFIIYGMTADALCGLFPISGSRILLPVIAFFFWVSLLGLLLIALLFLERRIKKRFRSWPEQKCRRWLLRIAVWFLPFLLIVGFGCSIKALWDTVFDPTTCHGATISYASWGQFIFTVLLCGFSVLFLWIRPGKARKIFVFSLAAAVIFSLALWATGNSEANHQPYTTVLSVVVIPFILIAMVSPPIAKWFIRSYDFADKLKFHELLKTTELFQIRTEPELNCQRVWFALLATIFCHPLFLLFWPSLAAIVAPIGLTKLFFWITFGITYFFVFQSCITDRWNQTLQLVRRLLLTGLPLILSVVVIALGILRLNNVQYVSIILDAAPFGALTMGIGSAYVLFWLFELAINRPVMVELLALFKTPSERPNFVKKNTTRIDYDIEESCVLAKVKHNYRFLQLHGTGRFMVVGCKEDGGGRAWHFHNRPGLFQRVLGSNKGDSERDVAWSDLRRRIRGYFFVINALVVLIFAVAWYSFKVFDWPLERQPLIVVTEQELAGNASFSLKEKLIAQKLQNRPAILFAASGGGTRAALYSASVLQGLAHQGVGDDIVLLSGVSGGSASVAYFGANRQKLLTGTAQELRANWHEFIDSITYPFIKDVIEGGAEIHSVLNLSHLLEKSMDRNLGLGTGIQLGDIQDVGLIFNSTVAGHPVGDSSLARSLITKDTKGQKYVVSRGGRMIFTNLMYESGLPGDGVYFENDFSDATRFHMMVIRSPDVRITQAVTTTANFPAVFPNSDIWVEDAKTQSVVARYSITDGGALDNRGVLSMLYMLRSTLQNLDPGLLPEIHIVIADASAMSFDYSRDRGLAATFSASSKLQIADGLIRELLSEICQGLSNGVDKGVWNDSRIGCKTTIQLHFLAMPTVFRSRGGVGTHWMMPTLATLKDPAAVTDRKASDIDIPCKVLVDTIMTLHASTNDFCHSEVPIDNGTSELKLWICGSTDDHRSPDPHGHSWQNIVRELSSYAVPLQLLNDEEPTWRHCSHN